MATCKNSTAVHILPTSEEEYISLTLHGKTILSVIRQLRHNMDPDEWDKFVSAWIVSNWNWLSRCELVPVGGSDYVNVKFSNGSLWEIRYSDFPDFKELVNQNE